jgi:hypothetical protein
MPGCKVLFMKELNLSHYYEDVRNRTKSVRRLNLSLGCCKKYPGSQKDNRLQKSSANRLF